MAEPSLQVLPDSKSSTLCLRHPTPDECIKIWTSTSTAWRDSLTLPVYLAESKYLATIPLARDGGMTSWILVDGTLPPNQRHILSSCENFRKRSLASDAEGNVSEGLIHGIASVFCAPEYRRRGYPARHMAELARQLRSWQSEHGPSLGSVLYSDIGGEYYSRFGWAPNADNCHFDFLPIKGDWPEAARPIPEGRLAELCDKDEAMVRTAMSRPEPGVTRRVTILPDLDHVLWHLRKEEFATEYIFGKTPQAKGVIVGAGAGREVWAIWTHRYYDHPEHAETPDNVLYILRLVVEGDETANRVRRRRRSGEVTKDEEQKLVVDEAQAEAVRVIIEAAQAEAAEWRLQHVKLWDPSPLVERIVQNSGMVYERVERTEESVACGMWFDQDGELLTDAPAWINNEHYAWC